MKKAVATIMAMVLAMSLTACGGSSSSSSTTTAETTAAAAASSDTDAVKTDTDINLDNPSTSGKTLTLSLNHVGSTTHPYQYGAGRFAQLLNEYSNGEIGATIYPASQIASGAKAIEAVQLGTLDICLESTMALENFVVESGVLNMPFIFTTKEEAYTVLDGEFGDKLKAIAEEDGFKILCWMDNGFRDISNSVRPITCPDDLKGIKMRTPESSVFIDTFETLGSTATAMATSELFSALQLGTVDGQENATSTFYNNKYYEVNKYYSVTHHIYTAEPLIMSLEKWNSLTAEQQEIIQKAANEACAYEREISDAQTADLLEAVKEKCEVNELTDEAVAQFKTAVEPVYEKEAATYGDLITEVRDAVAALQ